MTDLREIICCPRCSSRLRWQEDKENLYLCCNPACKYSKEGFFELASQPILVDWDRSILSKNAFLHRNGQSYKNRDDLCNSARTQIFRLFFGENQVARRCCARFIMTLKKNNKHPRVLVIGGGARGNGTDELYEEKSLELTGTDIYIPEYKRCGRRAPASVCRRNIRRSVDSSCSGAYARTFGRGR
jgi:uncharacterized protein YbaR (Trm112 family)